jgi:hypothetical protein
MKGTGVAVVLALPLAIILGLVLAISTLGDDESAANADSCTPAVAGTVPADQIADDASVAGYGPEQLTNAAAIVNAAAASDLPAAAQSIGVQAAIGESSLVNIDHGDGAINPDGSVADSIGLFQQQSSWGTVEQRMDPATAASLFFDRLATVGGWEALDPSIAINAVQINADPYHYAAYRTAAVEVTTYLAGLSGAGGGGANCHQVAGDSQELAQGLVTAIDNGSLTMLESRYGDQLVNMANGSAGEGCVIDERVLQFITLALNTFKSVGISDLNRQCTGSLLGAGVASSHWVNGGGMAVDFYSLDGISVTGSNSGDLALVDLLSSVAPDGTRIGQVNCRSGEQWAHLSQINDSCNHQHIDFAFTDSPLNIVKNGGR